MKSIFTPLLFCLLSLFAQHSYAQLSPGDIMFIAFNFDSQANGNSNCGDGFTFVSLVDIPAGTQIFFGEDEYNNGFPTSFPEGDLEWVNTTGAPLPAGTVVQIVTHSSTATNCGSISSSSGSVQFVGPGNWSLSTSNEEIIAYQGAVRNPTVFLSLLLTDNTNGENVPPPSLTGFVLDFTTVDQDVDLGVMTMGTNCGSKNSCVANITNLSNWETEDSGGNSCCNNTGVEYPDDIPASFPGLAASCNNPSQPALSGPSSVCPGASVTINISGSLNDATEWSVYSGSCGGTFITSTTGTSFSVSPTANTTYFVTGTGGCVSTQNCGSKTITVNGTTANAGPDQLASGTITTLAGNNPSPSSGMWSIVSGPGGSFGNASSPTSSFSGIAGQSYVLRWTINNGSCGISSDDVKIAFSSPSNLMLGDIAFVEYASTNTDYFSVVALTDFNAGTTMSFTENGWFAGGGFRSGEGTLTATWSCYVTCGSVFQIKDDNQSGTWTLLNSAGDEVGTVVENTNFQLSIGGDQIFAYQGSVPTAGNEANFRAAIQMNGDWDVDAGGSTESAKPSIFVSNPNTSVAPNPDNMERDNAVYDCSVTAGDQASLLAAINDPSNWSDDASFDNPPSSPTFCNFSCQACDPPIIAGISQNPDPVCAGSTVTITVGGNLNGAARWVIYSDVCGGTEVASSTTTSNPQISFTANVGGTYFVAGVDGCVTTPNCSSFSLNVEGVAANAGADVKVPQGTTTTTLMGNAPPMGAMASWTFAPGGSGDGNGMIANPGSPSTSFSGTAGQSYTLRYTIMNPGCPATFDDVLVAFLDPTNLSVGDIAFLAYNSDNTDDFAIVLLTDVAAGTQITFTERGWLSGGGFNNGVGENTFTMEFCRAYACGTEIDIFQIPNTMILDVSGNTAATLISGVALQLSSTGDQIFAYQGAEPTGGNQSTFLAAIQMNGPWDATSSSASTSAKPSIFTDGVNSISISPEVDNARYDCSENGPADASSLAMFVNNAANWSTSNSEPYALPLDCGISCCADATITSVTATPQQFCPGETVTLEVMGSLNEATMWVWYESGCGQGTAIGTGASIDVMPTGSTTYFVRGEGGCVGTTGMCGSVSVMPDNTPPNPVCPADVVVSNDAGQCGAIINVMASATDNCGVPNVDITTAATLVVSGNSGIKVDDFITHPAIASNQFPQEISIGPDGNVYISFQGQGRSIWRWSGLDGTLIDVFVPPGTLSNAPVGMAFGPDNDLYVSDGSTSFTSRVLQIDGATGGLLNTYPPTGGGDLWDLTFGPDGALYVGRGNMNDVIRLDIGTGSQSVFAAHPNIALPHAITFGPDGNLLVPNWITGEILRFDGTTGAFINSFNSGLAFPSEMLPGPDGLLYIMSNSEVRRYNSTTGALVDVFASGLSNGRGMVFGPGGLLYILEAGENRVSRWAPNASYLFPVGTTSVTVTATDGSGNSAMCSYNVTVNDTEAPDLTCVATPANRNNDPGECNYTAQGTEFDATAMDNCPGVTVTNDFNNSSSLAGEDFPVGATTVVWTATDAAGNQASCFVDIVITDNEDPVITCQNVSLELGMDGTVIFNVFVDNALVTRSDNCGLQGGAFRTGPGTFTCAQLGDNPITIFQSDIYGNQATCNITLTILDNNFPCNEPPVAACRALTVDADANCQNNTTVAADFNNGSSDPDGDALSFSVSPAAPYSLGTTNVVLTVSDGMESDTCQTTITVVDNTDPVIDCSGIDANRDNDPGTCRYIVQGSEFNPTFSDNCPGATLTNDYSQSDDLDGAIFPVGTTTVIWTATDAAGRTASCSIDVVISDTEDPVISCPGNFVVDNDPGECEADVDVPNPTFSDNCPGPITIDGRVRPIDDNGNNLGPWSPWMADLDGTYAVGRYRAQYRATDQAGNRARCSFVFRVSDTEDPAISCPSNFVVDNDPGECEADVDVPDPTFSDNCPGPITIEGRVRPIDDNGNTLGPWSAWMASLDGTYAVGRYRAQYRATDQAGNRERCTFAFRVSDTEDPVVTCPGDITVDNDPGECGADVFYSLTVNDNCPGVTVDVNPSGSFFPVGTTTVTVTATDAAGNMEQCFFDVTVNDTEDPEVTCPANITLSNDPGECGADVNFAATATDNCPGLFLSYSAMPGSFFPVGTTTVSVTATDASGNDDKCSFDIMINDTENPVITQCEGQTVVFNGMEEVDTEDFVDFAAMDNCEIVSTVFTPATISCEQLGETISVSVTVTDAAGNPATCVTSIFVDGLPCGFMEYEEHIDCAGSDVTYDVQDETFTLTSENCYYANPFNSDEAAYVKAVLCGDGEIIAEVQDIDGNGWAGVVFRESNDDGSKKFALSTNLSNFARREMRTTTNGPAYPQQFPAFNKYWLRLVRTGNQYRGFVGREYPLGSGNVFWQQVMVGSFPMNECIEAGLFVTNFNPQGTVVATFGNVSVNESGNNNLQVLTPELIDAPFDLNQDVLVYPNPATEVVYVDLSNFGEQQTQWQLLDARGQLVLQRQLGKIDYQTEQLEVNNLPAGVYWLQIQTEAAKPITKRIVIQR